MSLRAQGWQEGSCLPIHMAQAPQAERPAGHREMSPPAGAQRTLAGSHRPASGLLSQAGDGEQHCQEKMSPLVKPGGAEVRVKGARKWAWAVLTL